jgi:hypothetical protein
MVIATGRMRRARSKKKRSSGRWLLMIALRGGLERGPEVMTLLLIARDREGENEEEIERQRKRFLR